MNQGAAEVASRLCRKTLCRDRSIAPAAGDQSGALRIIARNAAGNAAAPTGNASNAPAFAQYGMKDRTDARGFHTS